MKPENVNPSNFKTNSIAMRWNGNTYVEPPKVIE